MREELKDLWYSDRTTAQQLNRSIASLTMRPFYMANGTVISVARAVAMHCLAHVLADMVLA